jgi:hypothetical protein
MNENDLRDCFAMFAVVGLMHQGKDWEAKDAWEIADAMLEARNDKEEELGIAAVKTKRQYVRKANYK